MSDFYDSIDKVNTQKDLWCVVGCIVKKWSVNEINGQHPECPIELIIMDSKGDKIGVSVPRSLYAIFHACVREDEIYIFANLNASVNEMPIRSTQHGYHLTFNEFSKVKKAFLIDDTFKNYKFQNPESIFSSHQKYDCLVDVIGILTEVSIDDSDRGLVNEKMTLITLDNNGFKFQCVLCGTHAEKMHEYILTGEQINIVVALMFSEIKKDKNNKAMIYTVQSSKLMLNPHFEVAEELITRMVDNENYIIPEVKILSQSDMLDHEYHVLSIAPKATIGGLAVTDVPATYIVLGTIKGVVAENGWWYGSCRCMRRVIPADGVYFCDACNRHILQVIPRYRFHLKVHDHKSSATFNVLDKAAQELFNISCSDMILSQGTESIADEDSIPTAISAIVNKSYLFMVDVKPNNINQNVKNYIVKRMIDDPVLIGKIGTTEIDD